ncbi:acetate/propionate family kinase [Rhodoligotrophos ferricapiens]|uniref:acetate/propionate family kinase n=1 Tax=Rhodoligotrophos ferricapiens TaxID=3069264 RepID=UPI00315CD914
MTRSRDAQFDADVPTVLAFNAGSSSVKWAIFSHSSPGRRLLYGAAEQIGNGGLISVRDSRGVDLHRRQERIADHTEAFRLIEELIKESAWSAGLAAVGHRIVHGGRCSAGPVILTADTEEKLHEFTALAPLHQPHNLAGIAAARRMLPHLAQIGCFDTDFHRDMPRLAQLTTLPRSYFAKGIRRFGYHGLSFEYILEELRRDGVDVAKERIIVAHLGGGSSVCAIKEGRSIETTMGFSTLSGLPMGTRSGDLDPGLVLHLAAQKDMTIEGLTRLLYSESGMRGLSQLSGSMKELLDKLDEPAAREAVDVFCYHARQRIAGLTASLAGIDRLVFTGGIGANAPMVRANICAGLEYLGIALDERRNNAGSRLISSAGASVVVQAIATDEEAIIAKHVSDFLRASAESDQNIAPPGVET